MVRTFLLAAVAGALLTCRPAMAQEAPIGPKPGPEIAALKKTLARDWIIRGHIPAGMMWKNSPAVPTSGYWKCDWVLGGMWASCYVLDAVGPVKDGKGQGPLAGGQKWGYQALQYLGWDVEAKTYWYVGFDTEGGTYFMPGRLVGSKFIFESSDYRISQGIQQKFRFTWDLSDPEAVTFVQDNLVKGETAWKPFEISVYTPTTLPH
jgi:hypothetical protein